MSVKTKLRLYKRASAQHGTVWTVPYMDGLSIAGTYSIAEIEREIENGLLTVNDDSEINCRLDQVHDAEIPLDDMYDYPNIFQVWEATVTIGAKRDTVMVPQD